MARPKAPLSLMPFGCPSDLPGSPYAWRRRLTSDYSPLWLLLLSARQFSCTFRKPLPRSGKPGIERERLPEESNGTLVLIECSQIPSTIDHHGGIDRQHLEVYYVIFLKPQGAVSQATGLQAHVRQVVKALVVREGKKESTRNKLLASSEPPGPFPITVGGE